MRNGSAAVAASPGRDRRESAAAALPRRPGTVADVVAHRKIGESSPSGWPRRRTAGEFAWGGDHTETLGYSCAKLWDKVGYKVLQDPVEFQLRLRALRTQLSKVHLDDLPPSKIEAALRRTHGHVGRALRVLHPPLAHPPSDSVRREMAALTGAAGSPHGELGEETHIVPESVLQKIEDLPDEQRRAQMDSVRQKFKLIDTDGNG